MSLVCRETVPGVIDLLPYFESYIKLLRMENEGGVWTGYGMDMRVLGGDFYMKGVEGVVDG